MRSKRCAGFTLVEMLCTVVVLILVSMLMAVGVRLGVESFVKSVSSSEAQVLCSTLKTAVSDELRYAGTVDVEPDANDATKTVISFFSQNFSGASAALASFGQDTDGRVTLGGKKFLTNKSYPYNLEATVTLESYENGVFKVLITVTRKDQQLAKTEFEVKQLNISKNSETTAGA